MCLKHLAKDLNKDRIEINPGNLRCVCFLLHRDRIISIGLNSSKTHPLIKRLGYNMDRRRFPRHAELAAYMNAKKRGEEFDSMYVYRGIDADLPSQPCIECSRWIKDLNIRVVYTTEIGIAVVESYNLLGHEKIF